ncbi:hypothetical protein RhiirA5_380901 [Rhizophagus irregularis]|uniref:Uncharacterized protein n=1 Tax=Rhizophagus irregularis TaxID=588596 RepID=A0A2N0P6V0_9GLOM|nr:hypothetical protein RhiirA5_380901 [Rhizophagus irregularis]
MAMDYGKEIFDTYFNQAPLILLPLVHLLWMFIITIAPGIVFGVLLSDESYYLYKISTDDILKLKDDMKLKEVILKLKDDVKPKKEYGLKLEEIAGLFEGVDSGRLKMFQILTRVDKEIIDKNCEDIKNIEDSLENLNHR